MLVTKKIKSSDIVNVFNAIQKINKGQSIDNAIQAFDEIKRSFIFLTVQEYYRKHLNTLEIIKKFSHKNSHPEGIIIIQIAIIMIFFSNKPEHAIVHDAVEFGKYFKISGFINALLRKILSEKDNIQKNMETHMVDSEFKKQLIKIYSSKKIYDYIFETLNKKPINYQISYDDNIEAIYDSRVSILKNFDDLLSKSWVQDIGNYECIKSVKHLVREKKVLDCCAAPGGKSFLLSSFGCEVTSLDNNEDQINKFYENTNRLNLKLKIQEDNFLTYQPIEKFDCILLDAPCSSLGTFRRNPDVSFKIKEMALRDKQILQLKMLEKASSLVSENGIIIYMVCSFHSIETIEVIDKFLKKNIDFNTINLKSDKLLKKNDGYFINPLSFKDFGGSDSFFISALQKNI
ncbi:methyltransferase domain-containing protein [Alphaproteobacteria bacterium]|nr:methyltransferase domain-containing protein [Alphaproteobacteria bacterium]